MRLFWLAICVAAISLGGVADARQPPSEVIFPPQSVPIKFSHEEHLRIKLRCDFCHSKALASTSSGDNLLPSETPCRFCHKIERDKPHKEALPEASCDACHAGPDPVHPVSAEIDANIKFNHKIHVDLKIDCEKCHGDVRAIDLATRDNLPRMPMCLSCHNQTVQKNRAPAKCSTCHLSAVDGLTIETHYSSGELAPSGTLKGDAHTPEFARNHAQVASTDERYCENCHRRDFCNACHNGVVKPMSIHGNDYISIHPIDARKDALRCDGCHRRQTFCLGCHERSGVTDKLTADTPNRLGNVLPARRFHPPYDRWVAAPRTPDHHSWQAQRNIKQCIGCHREESCLECHSATSSTFKIPGSRMLFNVSPHPPGFAGSRQCQAVRAANGRVCLKCHGPSDDHVSCR